MEGKFRRLFAVMNGKWFDGRFEIRSGGCLKSFEVAGK
jgi:hypothetical protein